MTSKENASNTRNPNWLVRIMSKLQKRYAEWDCHANEEKRILYLSSKTSPQKEIFLIEIEEGIILIMVKSRLKKRELTDGGIRVLNHLNCKRYYLTHQVDVERRLYKCRCIIPKNLLEEQFEQTISYIEGEHRKGKMLLEMECK